MSSEKIRPFHERMLEARREIGATEKGAATTFGPKFNYHSVGQVLDTVRGAFNRHGILVWCDVLDCDIFTARDAPVSKSNTLYDQERTYIKVRVELKIQDAHDPAMFERCSGIGIETTEREVGGGIATAYATKQALMKSLLFGEGEDAEENKHRPAAQEPVQSTPPPPGPAERRPGPEDLLNEAGKRWLLEAAAHFRGTIEEPIAGITRARARALYNTWKLQAEKGQS